MRYYKSMQELIGHTPLVELTHFKLPEGVRLIAKLELWNPGGSTKDRVGRAMIEAAEVQLGNIVVPIIDRAERYFSKKLLG